MTDFADTNNGYEPTGGWGYSEYEAASNEAWAHYTAATNDGDTAGASHWADVANASTQASNDIYASGGDAYGTGGDASGFNDGSYFGADAGSAGAGDTPMEYSAYGGSDSASMIDSAGTDITSVL